MGAGADSETTPWPRRNGLYTTEGVYVRDTRAWGDVDKFGLAIPSWAHWVNESRLHGHCQDTSPPEVRRSAEVRVDLGDEFVLAVPRGRGHADELGDADDTGGGDIEDA